MGNTRLALTYKYDRPRRTQKPRRQRSVTLSYPHCTVSTIQ